MTCNSFDTEIAIAMAHTNSRESNQNPIFDKHIEVRSQLMKMETRVHNLRDRLFEIDENDDSDTWWFMWRFSMLYGGFWSALIMD